MTIEACFIGTLGRDAESKTSKTGRQYLRLNARTGEGDKAVWVSVTSFDEKAIEAADKLLKGAKVYVEGKLSLDSWTSADGTAKHGLSILSFHTRLCAIGRNRPKREREPKSGERDGAAPPSSSGGGSFYDDSIPFAAEFR